MLIAKIVLIQIAPYSAVNACSSLNLTFPQAALPTVADGHKNFTAYFIFPFIFLLLYDILN